MIISFTKSAVIVVVETGGAMVSIILFEVFKTGSCRGRIFGEEVSIVQAPNGISTTLK